MHLPRGQRRAQHQLRGGGVGGVALAQHQVVKGHHLQGENKGENKGEKRRGEGWQGCKPGPGAVFRSGCLLVLVLPRRTPGRSPLPPLPPSRPLAHLSVLLAGGQHVHQVGKGRGVGGAARGGAQLAEHLRVVNTRQVRLS